MHEKNLALVVLAATALVACGGGQQKPADMPPNESPTPATGGSETTQTTQTTAAEGMPATSAPTDPSPTSATPAAPYDSTRPRNTGTAPGQSPAPTRIPAPTADRSNANNNDINTASSGTGRGAGSNATVNNSNSHDRNNAQLPAPAPSGSVTAMDQGNSDVERKITADIRKRVVGDGALSFIAKNVAIITIGGKVTLRGAVKSAQEKSTIERYAKATPGVTEVDNELEVKK